MDKELKKCPFCGHNATLRLTETAIKRDRLGSVIERKMGYLIRCNKCSMATKTFNTERQALEWWNRRV